MYLCRGNRDTRSQNRRFDLELYAPNRHVPKFVFECKSLSTVIHLIEKGATSNISDNTDYARQIRNDCLNKSFSFSQGWTVPILSDENISTGNIDDFILKDICLEHVDFEKNITSIISYLKCRDAEPGA